MDKLMQITLPGGRKATVIGQVTDKMIKIRLEDGRETLWTTDKLPKQTEGEDTLKLVVIPAIDRLEEMAKDRKRLTEMKAWITQTRTKDKVFIDMFNGLYTEALKEFKQKWGLI